MSRINNLALMLPQCTKCLGIFLALVLQALAHGELESARESVRPNVLFVVCDDLNDISRLLSRRGVSADMPNLNRLAEEGILFTNAHANVALCVPSRASFWNGLNAHTFGGFGNNVDWERNSVLKSCVPMMQHFKDHGYEILGGGKLLHKDNVVEYFINDDGVPGYTTGFDYGPWPFLPDNELPFFSIRHSELPPQLSADVWAVSLDKVPSVKVPGNAEPIKGWFNYDGIRKSVTPFKYNGPEDRDAMSDERVAGWAVQELSKPHEKPFFMAVGFVRPHAPIIVPQEYLDQYPLESVKLALREKDYQPPHAGYFDNCAKSLVYYNDYSTGIHGKYNYLATMEAGGMEALRRWTQAYLSAVAFVDAQLGKVLDALLESPYADNTILVFTSDNGYQMGERRYLFKNSPWEEASRVPLIFSGPGIKKAGRSDSPVSLIDIYPTLIDLCGLSSDPHRKKGGPELDGISLKRVLSPGGPDRIPDREYIALWLGSEEKPDSNTNMVSPRQAHIILRSERYRYIRTRQGDEELYDMQMDPRQVTNLIEVKQMDGVRQRLRNWADALQN